jgi:hypothetical protein
MIISENAVIISARMARHVCTNNILYLKWTVKNGPVDNNGDRGASFPHKPRFPPAAA